MMMQPKLLECCVDSVESAVIAAENGADRLELCANLVIGGTSPSPALFQEVQKRVKVPVRVLLRPRFGDFLYTGAEFAVLRQEVRLFRELGADGLVFGCLTAEGALDRERLAVLMEEAGPLPVTLHRAFDLCADPFAALETARELGIGTILTSGQAASCLAGRELLAALCRKAEEITILAGAGVDAAAIVALLGGTPVRAFHMSGKEVLKSGMRFRREGVPMGLPGMSEYSLWRTSPAAVRAARRALDAGRDA